MKQGLYVIILIVFLNCNGTSKVEKQNFERVKISNEMFSQYSEFENLFICKDTVEDFDNG